VKGTRAEIVELLRDRGELTVQGLIEHLPLAPAAIRRHLDILVGEGNVEYRSVKQSTGRPYYAYRLSERAREQFSTGYPRLMERLILETAALDTATVAEGHLLETVFDRVSDRLVAEHGGQIHGKTLGERVESVTSALREEGILATWSRQADGYHLYNTTCPHYRAARASSGICCSSERRAIALLLDTEVEQINRIAEGRALCEYIVPERGLRTQDSGLSGAGVEDTDLPAS
jgi:predicted ArsR family transcriptional regulator